MVDAQVVEEGHVAGAPSQLPNAEETVPEDVAIEMI